MINKGKLLIINFMKIIYLYFCIKLFMVDLFEIAFLNKGTLTFALENYDLGISSVQELKAYLKDYCKKNPRKFSELKSKLNIKDEEVNIIIEFENGQELIAIFKENTNIKRPEGQFWALVRIEGGKKRDYLYEFAEFYGFNPKFKNGIDKLQQLVNLAIKENWGKDNIGLVKYIENTFHYLYENEREKIVETADKEYAVFNTGLVSKTTWDPIYAFFEKNKSRRKPHYKFRDFCTQKNTDGKLMNDYIHPIPERANYFTQENAAKVLIFDHTKEILPDLEHIVNDGLRRNRFPEGIKKKFNIKDEDIRNDSIPNGTMNKFISCLEESINKVKLRVSQNYKIALPMYYPKQNKMSFLLPIVLGDNVDDKADLALVVSLTKNEVRYQGQTVLTLPMAYSNSRLICKPSNEWLEIDANSEIDDE